ncbi:MAG: GNAT family N-acetyltransferase [Bdellovibrionales bacterium]
MNLQSLCYHLAETELIESAYKHSRLLTDFDYTKNDRLNVREIEKSLVSFSPLQQPPFRDFNVARIQDTSCEGIVEIDRILSENTKSHVLTTVPLGLSDAAYTLLSELGYRLLRCRSVLYSELSMLPEPHGPQVLEIVSGNSERNLAAAFDVLNSFYPTTADDFRRAYTYWLKDNERAELFIALAEALPVGMGILSWIGPCGFLSSGVVAPSHRGRGIQKQLIHLRVQKGRQLGLPVLFAPGVPPFSASEASLKGCGFQLLCTRAIWRKGLEG